MVYHHLWAKGFQFCNSIQTVPQKLSQLRKRVMTTFKPMTRLSLPMLVNTSPGANFTNRLKLSQLSLCVTFKPLFVKLAPGIWIFCFRWFIFNTFLMQYLLNVFTVKLYFLFRNTTTRIIKQHTLFVKVLKWWKKKSGDYFCLF